MAESMRVPDEFSAIISALRADIYTRTGRMLGVAEAVLLFVEVAEINQRKLAAKLETFRIKKKATLTFSRDGKPTCHP